MEIKVQQELYGIVNKDGKWFRRIKNPWSGKTPWGDFDTAFIWPKPAAPRAVISRLKNDKFRPEESYLVRIPIGNVEVINEEERLEKAKKRKQQKLQQKKNKYRQYLQDIIDGKDEYAKKQPDIYGTPEWAQKQLNKLNNGEFPYYEM